MEDYKPLLCIVDDDEAHLRAMAKYLTGQGYRVDTFTSAEEFLSLKDASNTYDLLISDINMPGLSGLSLCRAIRASREDVRLPIILITGSDPSNDHANGLDAGADEFISKPFSTRHLLAKVRSLLEIRARDLQKRKELLSSQGLNNELSRFVSPNVATHLSHTENQAFLQPHRADVTVLFTDLRRFTAFSEKANPEEVLEVLREYYSAVGRAAMKYKGTLGHLAGDGIMVFFNDPVPVKDHMQVAILMALEAREELRLLKKNWDHRQYDIDFGIGISEGSATIGGIGFDRFSQYSVIGTVTNFASRLCHIAVDGQILVSHRYISRLNPGFCDIEHIGDVNLKGIEKAVSVYNIKSLAESVTKAG